MKNKITVEVLDLALRMANITLDHALIRKIIDLVELIENKGGEANINDVAKLISKWADTKMWESLNL
jgi:hypothetical protein